jgi:hypothetical protein
MGGNSQAAASLPRVETQLDTSLQQQADVTTITYTHDPLYRLTGADYSDGCYFHFNWQESA